MADGAVSNQSAGSDSNPFAGSPAVAKLRKSSVRLKTALPSSTYGNRHALIYGKRRPCLAITHNFSCYLFSVLLTFFHEDSDDDQMTKQRAPRASLHRHSPSLEDEQAWMDKKMLPAIFEMNG
jgi:hypothetical protein